jgi:hypothetical protein
MNVRSMMVAVAVLTPLACARYTETSPKDDTAHLQPTKDDSAERTAAAQNRIAGAFYSSLVPKLKTCWDDVKGQGEIRFKYTYRREGNNWLWQGQELDGSSLDKGQDAAALACMQDAARGSTFPLEPEEATRASKELVVYWGWPVPLPPDTTQLARMIDTGGGGECRKSCKDCAWSPVTHKSSCISACSGFSGCVGDGTGTGCRMTRPECKSGWSGPWVGGAIAFEEAATSDVQGR